MASRRRGHVSCGLGFAASARDCSFLYVVIEGRFEVMAPLCARAPIVGILETSISANVSRMDRHMGGPTLLHNGTALPACMHERTACSLGLLSGSLLLKLLTSLTKLGQFLLHMW